jgi:DNA (cytosine-5)-methyltransferase 1
VKVLELFAGIGACSKALERLGIEHEIVDAVEIDKYAIKSFNAIHGTNFETQDITKWDKDIECDLIMHGSPCQDFSLAGKQAGGDMGSGTRSSLMYETIRIVGKLRPKYVIWENVKNVLSAKHKHNFDNYLTAMSNLGYTNYYQVLNAKDYGIPQNRERVFTVSILKDSVVYDDYNSNIRKDQGTIGTLTTNCGSSTNRNGWKIIEHTQAFEFPPKQELKLRLKDMLEPEVDRKYYLSDEQVEKIKSSNFMQEKKRIQEKDCCDTLLARDWKDPKCVEVKSAYFREYGSKGKLQGELADTLQAAMGCGGGNVPLVEIKANRLFNIYGDDKGTSFAGNVWDKEAISPTLTNMQGGNRQPMVLIKNATKKGYLEAYEGDGINISSRMCQQRGNVQKGMIQTITTSGGNDRGVIVVERLKQIEHEIETLEDEALEHLEYLEMLQADEEFARNGYKAEIPLPNGEAIQIRKLTPKECWRLMGFDDTDFEKAEKINSNTQLYKQAGNSIVVNVLEAILKNLVG